MAALELNSPKISMQNHCQNLEQFQVDDLAAFLFFFINAEPLSKFKPLFQNSVIIFQSLNPS
jgi:hypothetical protein